LVVGTFPMAGAQCRVKPGVEIKQQRAHPCLGNFNLVFAEGPPPPPPGYYWEMPSRRPLKPAKALYQSWDRAQRNPDGSLTCMTTAARCSRTDMSGMNFDGQDMTGIACEECNMRGASFRGATLTKANLQRADISGAQFDRANLEQAIFTGADMNQVSFRNANLQRTVFTNLREGLEPKADFVVFDGADLRTAAFTDSTLSYASFRNANLAGFKAEDCWVLHSDFRGATFKTQTSPAQTFFFIDGVLENSTFAGADLSGCTIKNNDWERCHLQGASFQSAEVTDGTFAKAIIQGTDFTDAFDLKKVSFAGAVGIPYPAHAQP